jgi:beta-lactamase class A
LILDGQTLQFAGKRMEEAVPSASVIKLPLLYLYALHLNNGNLTNETPAYFGEHHMVSGSGDWQFLGANKFYTAFQTAEAMIQNSDNSATELMTSLLGGKHTITQQFKALGLQQTALKNMLPDVEGYNTISVYDMVTLLFNLKEQPSLTIATKSTAMEILEGTRNRRLIPALLPPETLVAHKTGDIGKSLGETALVYLPDGRYYYLSVMVERPHNHEAAKDYIQRLSKGIWNHYIAQMPEGVLSQPKQPSKSLPLTTSDAEIF